MSQSKIKVNKSDVIADRLKQAADIIRAGQKLPDPDVANAIGDSKWFREYSNLCLQAPIANAFLGCILFGWQLCEEYNKLKEGSGIIYRA